MGSWKGRGNQYIQFVRVLYCKLPTNGKQLPAFPLEAVPETEPQPERWEASVTTLPPWPLCPLLSRTGNLQSRRPDWCPVSIFPCLLANLSFGKELPRFVYVGDKFGGIWPGPTRRLGTGGFLYQSV